jgi:hypothetical protein
MGQAGSLTYKIPQVREQLTHYRQVSRELTGITFALYLF